MDMVSFFVTHAQTSIIEQPVGCGFQQARRNVGWGKRIAKVWHREDAR